MIFKKSLCLSVSHFLTAKNNIHGNYQATNQSTNKHSPNTVNLGHALRSSTAPASKKFMMQ